MKISKEDKIRVIMDELDKVISIPFHKEERVKDALRDALRKIEDREDRDSRN